MGNNCCIYLESMCCIYPRNGYSLLSSIAGRDTSPLPPPRGINSNHGSNSSLASNSNSYVKSEFYVPAQTNNLQLQNPQQTQLYHPHAHQHSQHHHHNSKHSAKQQQSNTVFYDFQNHNNSVNFNEIHEQFRRLVMKDILEYQAQREIKTRPLIQL